MCRPTSGPFRVCTGRWSCHLAAYRLKQKRYCRCWINLGVSIHFPPLSSFTGNTRNGNGIRTTRTMAWRLARKTVDPLWTRLRYGLPTVFPALLTQSHCRLFHTSTCLFGVCKIFHAIHHPVCDKCSFMIVISDIFVLYYYYLCVCVEDVEEKNAVCIFFLREKNIFLCPFWVKMKLNRFQNLKRNENWYFEFVIFY